MKWPEGENKSDGHRTRDTPLLRCEVLTALGISHERDIVGATADAGGGGERRSHASSKSQTKISLEMRLRSNETSVVPLWSSIGYC